MISGCHCLEIAIFVRILLSHFSFWGYSVDFTRYMLFYAFLEVN